jgi:hypothetical protein
MTLSYFQYIVTLIVVEQVELIEPGPALVGPPDLDLFSPIQL